MSTYGAIQHPAIKYGAASKAFVILGIVKSYTYVKWVTPEGLDTWDGYVNNHDRLSVEWATIDADHTGHRYIDMNNTHPPTKPDNNLVDFYIKTPPVHHSKLDIVLKRNNCNLLGLNGFLVKEITENFLFSPDEGWRHCPDE